MSISTHILNTATGCPAGGLAVELDRDMDGEWQTLNARVTDDDGRIRELLPEGCSLEAGSYCIRFATATYFARENVECLYPLVEITFTVRQGEAHYHIPLLLTPNGYTTYRGS